MVTAITVMQANVGASIGQAVDRLLGSLLGVIVGGAVAIAARRQPRAQIRGPRGLGAHARLRLRAASAAAHCLRHGRDRRARRSALEPADTFGGVSDARGDDRRGDCERHLDARFPSRSGPALAAHVHRTMPLYFEVLRAALTWALGTSYSPANVSVFGRKIRAALATTNSLAADVKVELAGYLAHYPDPDALVRTLRRLWHTEIMLVTVGINTASRRR